jgi:hypothetical protein
MACISLQIFLHKPCDGAWIALAKSDLQYLKAGMILGAKFCSWANFPWFFQKQDSLF